jgi:nicotinate phosphoribosyltransferase
LNLTILTDFYELSMANGFLKNRLDKKYACFDMFFRKIPDDGGFAIMAGLENAIEYLKNLRFSDEEINYLKSKKIFCDEFIDYLKNFKFSCDVWAIPEGTPIFPQEPILTVRGPIMQAQLIETMLLLCINHQSLIATKANRIVRAAQDRDVMEFGARRAQGADAAISGARAAYIGGCVGTSCTYSDMKMGIPALGTMAHSWVQLFDSEYEAFCAYARTYPDNCSLLVDTYNTVKSGVPNAIRCFDTVLKELGRRPKSIRIDSGDIAYLSKIARRMLDDAGYPDCKIIASNSLDEYIIRDLLIEGAKIDIFGVGERLICAKSDAMFGGVYKLGALIDEDGTVIPKVKLSDNVGKITIPGFKAPWRLFDKHTGKAIADVITLADETIDESKPFELFDPEHTWKRKTVTDFVARKLQVPIFEGGKCVYESPSPKNIRTYCAEQVETIWDEVQRFENPHKYYVDLSQKLWDLRDAEIKKHV